VDGAQKGEIDFIYLLGADEFDVAHLGRAFVVYQGSHGDAGAHHADVILPGAAYTEKDGIYVNFEGRVQRGRRAAFPPGEAKEDWAILRALSEVLGVKLPYDDRATLLAAIEKDAAHFAALNDTPVHADTSAATWGGIGESGVLDSEPVAAAITDYYLTNAIARASETMAKCSQELVHGATKMAAE
jgi:NADH-quinone oxidoreductase subunit G